ncbi:hypothetical protein ABEF95_015298 [Exophiala dermatitidis]
MTEPLFPKGAFHQCSGITHVCAAGESLPLRSQGDAVARYLRDKANGVHGRVQQEIEVTHLRSLISESWQVTLEEIGFVSNVAEGVSLVLESLHWQDGDNVCVDVNEYPSLVAPVALGSQARQRNRGDRAPTVSESQAFAVRYCSSETLSAQVDHNTRIILVSYVSYLNGARVDLNHYRRLANSAGALLIVDFTQAAGYLSIDASIADFAFSACYKWLLGVTGTAIAYWNQSRQPRWKPATAGWYSLSIGQARPQWEAGRINVRNDALCFSRGNPSHVSIYMLREGIEFLKRWSPETIEQHVQGLTTELMTRLEHEEIPFTTPRARQDHGASVTIDCPGAKEIVGELDQLGIQAWNGRGRVRFSFHGYNCLDDVARIIKEFPRLWKHWQNIT